MTINIQEPEEASLIYDSEHIRRLQLEDMPKEWKFDGTQDELIRKNTIISKEGAWESYSIELKSDPSLKLHIIDFEEISCN